MIPRSGPALLLAAALAAALAGAGCATCGKPGAAAADSAQPPAKASFWESVFDQAISNGINNFLFRW